MQKSNTIWVIISDFLVASFSGRSRLPLVSLPRGLRVPCTPWGSLDAMRGGGDWEMEECVCVCKWRQFRATVRITGKIVKILVCYVIIMFKIGGNVILVK